MPPGFWQALRSTICSDAAERFLTLGFIGVCLDRAAAPPREPDTGRIDVQGGIGARG